jgi:hypothetical protein
MAALIEKDQVGKREALLDIISIVDAHETPVTAMLPKPGDPRNTLFDWQMDDFDAPRTQGVRDGEDVSAFENKGKNRVRASGRMMKLWRTWLVGDKAENVSDVAGAKSGEVARSKYKALMELKRDIEATICGSQDSVEETGTVAAVTRGIGSWISSSAQSDLPVNSSYRTPSASVSTTALASITEATISGVLKSLWQQTGKRNRYVGVCGIDFKERISTFSRYRPDVSSNTHIARFSQDAESRKILNVVDVFEADGGTVELMPHNFLAIDSAGAGDAERAYFLLPEYWQLRFNRMPRNKDLTDNGGGPRGLIDAILGLACLNPKGAAQINPT